MGSGKDTVEEEKSPMLLPSVLRWGGGECGDVTNDRQANCPRSGQALLDGGGENADRSHMWTGTREGLRWGDVFGEQSGRKGSDVLSLRLSSRRGQFVRPSILNWRGGNLKKTGRQWVTD